VTLNLERDSETTSPEDARPPVRKPFWRRPWVLPLAIAVVVYLYLETQPFIGVPLDEQPIEPHGGFALYYPALVLHICGGSVAMLTMILQVWPWLRNNHPKVHRISGRVYVISALIAGCMALVIVWWAPKPGKDGALCLAIVLLATTIAGYRAARRRDWEKHRRYMLYSFAIAANNMWAVYVVMAMIALHIPVDPVYFPEAARWIPWVGNLMLVQWWLYRTAGRQSPAVAHSLV
jgi:uncharacterized membrane protein